MSQLSVINQMNMPTANTARLLITCEDKHGIVQAVSS
ncbi:formyltetrahydrofolate deformylase, partial [Escherichia coli]